ncbi:MAG TPA: DUF222 domain-containing protein [Pseudonocardia sp.]
MLREVAAGFDASVITASDAVAIAGECAEIERLASGIRMAAAGRVAESGMWKAKGHRSPADWLAATSRCPVREAAAVLDTAKQLHGLPATAAAVRSGNLTPSQAGQVTSAAVLAPQAEADLLWTAAHASHKGLRDAAQKVRAGADDRNRATLDAAIHAARYVRTGVDEEGAFRLGVRGTTTAGARFLELFKPYLEKVFVDGRKNGSRDAFEARAFDALFAMAEAAHARSDAGAGAGAGAGGSSLPGGSNTKVIVRIDYSALIRGYPVTGETVEIAGLGPVSVDCVKAMMQDAFLAAVVTKGVDVANVVHYGRKFTAHQRTALEAVVAQECTNIACNQTVALELDHVDPWANTHESRISSAEWLCKHDHDLKTHHGYRLEPGTGRRRLLAPREPNPPPRPPPHAVGRDPTVARR